MSYECQWYLIQKNLDECAKWWKTGDNQYTLCKNFNWCWICTWIGVRFLYIPHGLMLGTFSQMTISNLSGLESHFGTLFHYKPYLLGIEHFPSMLTWKYLDLLWKWMSTDYLFKGSRGTWLICNSMYHTENSSTLIHFPSRSKCFQVRTWKMLDSK